MRLPLVTRTEDIRIGDWLTGDGETLYTVTKVDTPRYGEVHVWLGSDPAGEPDLKVRSLAQIVVYRDHWDA